MITQNKGEWSELYVFLKLLGDGVLYAADADLNKIEDLYYPLIEILRKENEQVKHYVKDSPNIEVKDDTGNILLKLPMSEFETKAKILLDAIKKSDSTFAVPEIEDFMNIIQCTKVKADSLDKSYIAHADLGFSLDKRLGMDGYLASYIVGFIFVVLFTVFVIKKGKIGQTKSELIG